MKGAIRPSYIKLTSELSPPFFFPFSPLLYSVQIPWLLTIISIIPDMDFSTFQKDLSEFRLMLF